MSCPQHVCPFYFALSLAQDCTCMLWVTRLWGRTGYTVAYFRHAPAVDHPELKIAGMWKHRAAPQSEAAAVQKHRMQIALSRAWEQATQPEHAETALPCCSTAPTRSASHVSRRQAPLRQPGALHGCNRVPGGSGRGRALVQAQARTGSAPTACAMPPGRSRKNVDASCPRRPAVGATRRLLAQSTDGDLTATTRGLAVRAPGARGLTGRDRVHASTPGDSSRPRARAAPAAPCCWRASWPGTRGSRSRRPCRCQTSGSSSAPPAGRRQRPAAPFEAARQGLRKA